MSKYEVTIISSEGACKETLFQKMAKKGDITATKISEAVGEVVRITGYAICNIKTEENDFDLTYFTTDDGRILSSASEIFKESVLDYLEECDKMRITKIKTKKGFTYKAVPVIRESKETNNEQTTTNEEDLPF